MFVTDIATSLSKIACFFIPNLFKASVLFHFVRISEDGFVLMKKTRTSDRQIDGGHR